MKVWSMRTVLAGQGSSRIRVFNLTCLFGSLAGFLSALESSILGFSALLVASNAAMALLFLCFYSLSRLGKRPGLAMILMAVSLMVFYIPAVWILNGGSESGLPYLIVAATSFLAFITTEEGQSSRRRVLPILVMVASGLVTLALISLEFLRGDLVFRFESRFVRYADMAVFMVFAILGNSLILRLYVAQHRRDLESIKRYSQRLEELVRTDSMTGLLNHSSSISRLEEEIAKASRHNRSLSVIMLDLDHFKELNDGYGHQFGDEVLIATASSIRSCLRAHDIAARYGGEEFLVILPETASGPALSIALRVRQALASMRLSRTIAVTVSGGIAQYREGDNAYSMIARADELLYAAKRGGRDNIRSELADISRAV